MERAWKAGGFKVSIIKVPEEIINDKLAVLSDGTGTLTYSQYDQFLAHTCLADADKVYKFLNTIDENNVEELLEAALELRTLILEVNPLLNPEILVINSENVIKLPAQSDKPGETRLLIENPRWDRPDADIGGSGDEGLESVINSMGCGWGAVPIGIGGDNGNFVTVMFDDGANQVPLVIRVFSAEDIPTIFKDRCEFSSEEQYRLYIVTKCLVDIVSHFHRFDDSGLTKKYGSEKLTENVYNVILQYNSFLAFEEIDLSKVKKVVLRNQDTEKKKNNAFSKRPEEQEGTEVLDFNDLTEEHVVSLPERIKSWVVGQDEAVDRVCEAIETAYCGMKEKNTPIGVFMFTGSSGVGKTWCAKMFAKELCGSEFSMLRLDCSEYGQRHEVSKLIGAPAGYVGYDDGGQLINAMLKSGFRVLLLDEIEKANAAFFDLFLQVFDEGRLTSGKGETISFGQVLIIMTSNIGVKEVSNIGTRVGFGEVASITKDKQEKAIREALKVKFKPEFLNRVDSIITFNDLQEEACKQIIRLEFDKVNKWLLDKNVMVSYTDEAVKHIYERGFNRQFGARPLARLMRSEIMKPVSKLLLKEKVSNKTVIVDYKKDEFTFTVKKGAKK